jgi:hypothetical protein
MFGTSLDYVKVLRNTKDYLRGAERTGYRPSLMLDLSDDRLASLTRPLARRDCLTRSKAEFLRNFESAGEKIPCILPQASGDGQNRNL